MGSEIYLFSKVAACPENPVHDIIFEPKYGGLFETKPRSIATFGIDIRMLSKISNYILKT